MMASDINGLQAVTSMAIHGSGCILMSAGKDQSLSMWNLSTGMYHSCTISFIYYSTY